MHTVLSTIHTPTGYETIPVNVPTFATKRAIIRRVKSAHGIKAQHKWHEAIGPDGCRYLYIKLHGSKATIHIELDAMEDEA